MEFGDFGGFMKEQIRVQVLVYKRIHATFTTSTFKESLKKHSKNSNKSTMLQFQIFNIISLQALLIENN